MNTFQTLIPDIRVIESGLFPADRVQGADVDVNEHVEPVLVGVQVAIPAHVQQLIRRRAASAQPELGLQPTEGQVRWINAPSTTNGWPVAMLIDTVTGDRAHGWLVASESLYAAHDDWLLQDSEMQGELDPRTAMVQLWNRIELSSSQLGSCVGRLKAEALNNFRMVTSDVEQNGWARPEINPKPGRFGLLNQSGITFVCGTPLSSNPANDPRHRYRDLYRLYSRQLEEISHVKPAGAGRAPAANSSFWRRADIWRGAGMAAVLILTIMIPFELSQRNETSETRSIGVTVTNFGLPDRFMVMDIHFSRDATVDAISRLLRESQSELVAGPTDSGAYRVAFDKSQREIAIKMLGNSPLVVSVRTAER